MSIEDLFFDPHAELEITQRDRPHWKQACKLHFVTWRQADSLAQVQREALRSDREAWVRQHGDRSPQELPIGLRKEHHRLFHARVEEWLDAGAGSCLLRQPTPRRIMIDALRHFDGQRYQLGSFTVAGNHVHVLVIPAVGHELSSITHAWKSFTAHAINKALGRSGALWKAESFDHLVRSESALSRFETYIDGHVEQGAYVERRVLCENQSATGGTPVGP